MQEEPANPLMRKKKTPEELAKEAEMEEEDEFTSKRNVMCIYFIIIIFLYTRTHILYVFTDFTQKPKTHSKMSSSGYFISNPSLERVYSAITTPKCIFPRQRPALSKNNVFMYSFVCVCVLVY